MRVAVVVRSLKIGGMERSAINTANAFSNEGHESHLIYFKSKGAALMPQQSVKVHHFNIERILKLSVLGFLWEVFSKLLNIIIRNSHFFWSGMLYSKIFMYKIKKLEKEYGKFDLIILRGQGTYESLWMIKDNRVKQVTVSMFIRSGSVLKNFFLRCLFDKKHVICISSAIKDNILKVSSKAGFEPKSINIIHNTVDIESVRSNAREYEIDIKEKYILYFGRITPNKNVTLLIEAYNYAKRNLMLNIKLIIIGDGSEYENIQNQINSLKLQDSVIMLGALKNPYPWVEKAELFIFTSKFEGLGNVLLESLACHTPIVSVKTEGGPKDIMKNELEDYRVDFDQVILANKIMEVLSKKPDIDFDKYLVDFTPMSIVRKYIETLN